MENFPVEEWAAEIEQQLADFEQEVQQHLQSRYGRAFRIARMGNDAGGVVLYMHPGDDETLVFTVRVEEGPVIHEDYVARLRLREYERSLIMALSGIGIEAAVKAVAPDLETTGDPVDTPLSELLAREDVPGLLVRVALRGPVRDTAGIADVLRASGLGCATRAVFNGYVLAEAGFAACRGQFLNSPTVSDAIIASFDPSAEFSLVAEGGTCRVVSQRGIAIGGGDTDGR